MFASVIGKNIYLISGLNGCILSFIIFNILFIDDMNVYALAISLKIGHRPVLRFEGCA